MLLTNFIQLSSDLAAETRFYCRQGQELVPLSSIKLGTNQALFLTGHAPLSKRKLFSILGLTHNRGIPLLIKNRDQKTVVFGLQLHPEMKIAILM